MDAITVAERVEIETEGSALQREYVDALTEVRVHSESSLPSQCELTFVDSGSSPLEHGCKLGSALTVRVGSARAELFSGRVTAVEHVYAPSGTRGLRIRAYDALQALQQRRPLRAHVQTNLADLATRLVADLGVSVEAQDSGPVWPRIIQHNQSDFDLLTALAERCGLQFALRGTALSFFSAEGVGETVELKLGESLFEARVDLNAGTSGADVTASGWDPWNGEAIRATSNTPRRSYEIAGGLDFGLLAAQAGNICGGLACQAETHAQAFGQAQLDRLASGEVTFSGIARGDAKLRPGTAVKAAGLSSPLDGSYVLSRVTHIIDGRRGYLSQLWSGPLHRPRASAGLMSTLGVVSSIDDPDSLGRVQATLPALNDVETDWLQVVMVGAGAKKGLAAVPDVGDKVLVLCDGRDVAQGVILGGLYGRGGMPDNGLSGGKVARFSFQSPGGQRLRFDDDGNTVRLENDKGSYLELAPGKVTLHATTALEISAPGQEIKIRAKRVDFEQAD